MNNRGLLIIVSGPSGVGKRTTWSGVIEDKDLNLWMSVSATTRAMRPGETDGEDYYFLTKTEFKNKIDNNEFLEWSEHFNNYYGTPKAPIEANRQSGKNVILEIDTNGAERIFDYYKNDKDVISIFMLPPSLEHLRERLVSRGTETNEQINNRIMRASSEIEKSGKFDYKIVLDNIDTQVKKFKDIICSEIVRRT